MGTLLIENVNLRLLDRQRKILAETLMDEDFTNKISPDDRANLDGLLTMLDEWSDARHEAMWEDNSIQFPRLLCEIRANVVTSMDSVRDICSSMDITWDELEQLFDRAHVEWERIKETL